MKQVIWSHAAAFDVEAIRRYIEDFNPSAARAMAAHLVAASNSLAIFPARGRPVYGGVRELTVIYPYIIRYEVSADEVVILRIRHGRQMP